MKDLKVYMTESLMDMDPEVSKLSIADIKRDVNDWVRTYMQKKVAELK